MEQTKSATIIVIKIPQLCLTVSRNIRNRHKTMKKSKKRHYNINLRMMVICQMMVRYFKWKKKQKVYHKIKKLNHQGRYYWYLRMKQLKVILKICNISQDYCEQITINVESLKMRVMVLHLAEKIKKNHHKKHPPDNCKEGKLLNQKNLVQLRLATKTKEKSAKIVIRIAIITKNSHRMILIRKICLCVLRGVIRNIKKTRNYLLK